MSRELFKMLKNFDDISYYENGNDFKFIVDIKNKKLYLLDNELYLFKNLNDKELNKIIHDLNDALKYGFDNVDFQYKDDFSMWINNTFPHIRKFELVYDIEMSLYHSLLES